MAGRGLKRARPGEGSENEDKADVVGEHKSHKRPRSDHTPHELSWYPYSFNINNNHPRLPFPTSNERSTSPQLPLFYTHRQAHNSSYPISEACTPVNATNTGRTSSHQTLILTPARTSVSSSPPPIMGMRRSRVQLRRSSSSEGSGCRNPYVLDKKDEEEDSSDELDLGQPPSSSSTRSRGSTSSVDLMTLSALAIQESSGSPLSFNRTHTLRSSISSTTSQMIRTPTFTAYGGTSNAFRDLVISTSPDILSQPFSTSRRSHSKTPEGDDGDTEMQGRWKDAIIISDESDEDGPILIETGEEDINMRDGEGADTAIPKRINKQKATRRAGKRIISTRSTSTTFKSSTTGSVSSKTRQVDEAGKKSRKDTSLRRSRRLRSKDEEGAK